MYEESYLSPSRTVLPAIAQLDQSLLPELLTGDLPREAAHHQILGRRGRVVVIAKQVAVVAATPVEIARGRERGENGVAVERPSGV